MNRGVQKVRVCNVMHFQCVALFLITLIETWSLFSIFTTITLKKHFHAP